VQRGILGGTFDPPHIAHLIAGEVAYRELGLDVVTFIPAGAPWQKAGRDLSDAEHRWQMTSLAIDGIDYFEADAREVRRDGWSYTMDTLDTYPDDAVTLILGADAARGVPTWNRADELLQRADFAVMPRSGVDEREVEAALRGRVTWLGAPIIDLSGTMLRARCRAGASIRFLVRDPVWDYIESHGLYGDA
jgi:nicotinate-nucleotide adenylyltransferase